MPERDVSLIHVLTCYLPSYKVETYSSYTRPWKYYERGVPKTFLTSGLSRQYPTACIGGRQIWPLWVANVMAVKRLFGYVARKYRTRQGPYTLDVDDEGIWPHC